MRSRYKCNVHSVGQIEEEEEEGEGEGGGEDEEKKEEEEEGVFGWQIFNI